MQSPLTRIQETIRKHHLVSRKQKVLIAISGGPDSVFLAWVMRELGYKTGLAHINYHMRGQDSEYEEQLVRDYGRLWGVPVYIHSSDPKSYAAQNGLSFQVAAREIRYAFFEQLMDEHGYDCCATGHHADDRVESTLMNLIKGNNSQVLTAIPLQRDRYIRPLADIYREEIISTLQQEKLAFSHDISNDTNDYTRNKFRNQVIPLLEEINPSVSRQITEREEWYQLQYGFIAHQLANFSPPLLEEKEGERILVWDAFVAKFGEKFLPLLVVWALEKWGIHGHELWQCLNLIHAQTGKVCYAGEYEVIRTRSGLLLRIPAAETTEVTKTLYHLENPEKVDFRGQTIVFSFPEEPPVFGLENKFYIDPDRIVFPLTIRNWREGDKMQPLGMKTRKKLSDIFTDEKFSVTMKEKAIVFEDAQGIICLTGFRISERVRISSSTIRPMEISLLS